MTLWIAIASILIMLGFAAMYVYMEQRLKSFPPLPVPWQQRIDDALFDCYIATQETGELQPNCTHLGCLRSHYALCLEAGLLDEDEPHPFTFEESRQRLSAEFTPEERLLIRTHLGI